MKSESAALATEGDINTTERRVRWQETHLDPATRNLLSRDSDAFLHQSLSTPCLNALSSASGSWLTDLQGNQFLDFHGNSAHQLGYGHPSVIQALKDQLDTLSFCPRRYTNELSVRLAERLSDLAPGDLRKCLFAPSGTAAIGIALKLARWTTGRFKTISMWDSFHGASLDAISIGGESVFRQGLGPLLPGTEHVPPPDPIRCPLGCAGVCSLACASYLEYVLEKEGDVGAVIAEPIRSTTAVVPPAEYWMRVRKACDRHGALLIFDEIPTCLGRTGKFLATEHTGVVPDMVVLGKGLGGGIWPLAAILVKSSLDLAQATSLGHYTHEKSPLGAAAALAVLDVLEQESLVTRSAELGELLLKDLLELKARHPVVVDVRAQGLLAGIEVAKPQVAEEVLYRSLDLGLSFKVSSGTVLTLTPPLNISQADLRLALSILDQALSEAERLP